MRKRVIKQSSNDSATDAWLDLEPLAQVEVTSEEAANPIEGALLLTQTSGWRAAEPGEQRIRILFDEPQTLSRVHLSFLEKQEARTQEFVLRAHFAAQPLREIARQQYNFSPNGGTREVEDYAVELTGVGVLELVITPNISGGSARASLERLRLA